MARYEISILDELMDRYVDWRESCAVVTYTYRAWSEATCNAQVDLFTVYRRALDREERAADEYRRALNRTTRLLPLRGPRGLLQGRSRAHPG